MNAPEHQHLREVPQAIEAEQSILGALMYDNDAIDRIADLRSEHFFRYDHRLIFEEISRLILAGRTADIITVMERLAAAGKLEQIGGLAYLNTLVQNSPGSAGIRRWAEIVIERWKLRGILSAVSVIEGDVENRNGRTASEIIASAQALLEPLADTSSREPAFINTYLTPIIERIDEEFHSGSASLKKARSTGLRDLDAKLGGGMRGGQLIIVAGRPSMGKSAIALGVAESVAQDGETSMFFTQEMTGAELTNRSLSRASGLPLDKIMDGAKFGRANGDPDWSMLTMGVQKVSELALLIDETAGVSLMEIQARARAAKRRHGLGLVVVDYLGLMAATEGNNRTEQVGANSRGLKNLAKQLDVPIVLLAQLSRECEKRNNKRPIMSDLRDSGEIEQDADIILFLYRDEVYNPDSPDRGTAEINIAKQRNGPTGIVRAAYFGERTTFADLAPNYVPVPRQAPEKARRGFE
jgi:replicative DNA helicase